MRQDTSAFTGILGNLQRDSQYLAVILHSDSFEAFRALREIARAKKMAVGWEPYSGTDGKLYFSEIGSPVLEQG